MKALLAPWPVQRPRDWTAQVNRVQLQAQQEAIVLALKRSRPLGEPAWVKRVAQRYDLASTLRPRGRQPGWRKATSGTPLVKDRVRR
jgi:hypothetical protein